MRKNIDLGNPLYNDVLSDMRYNWGDYEVDIEDNDVYTSFIKGDLAVHINKGRKCPVIQVSYGKSGTRVNTHTSMDRIKNIYPSHSLGTVWLDLKGGWNSLIIEMK